jgi:hypothetical protein
MEIEGDVSVEAQYLLLGELIGLDNAGRAESWADELIAKSNVPAIEIIELSIVSAGDKKGLIAALEALCQPVRSSRQLTEALLARLRDEMASAALAPKQIAEMLYYFRAQCLVLTRDEEAEFSIATDKLEVADRYMGNLEQVTSELSAFLARYR